jgi:hypothetical protein
MLKNPVTLGTYPLGRDSADRQRVSREQGRTQNDAAGDRGVMAAHRLVEVTVGVTVNSLARRYLPHQSS